MNSLRAFKATLVNLIIRYRYLRGDDYRSDRYWKDRLGRYKLDIRGVGNKRLSVSENQESYTKARDTFIHLCRQEEIVFTHTSVLDIGCGNGFYTKVFRELEVCRYVGVDITNVLFDKLQREFPEFRFVKLDITSQPLGEIFDVIAMIDVTQHITDKAKFSYAMQNVKSHLSEEGVFVVTSWLEENARRSFYEVSRSLVTYQQEFSGFVFSDPLPFRDKYIFSLRRVSPND